MVLSDSPVKAATITAPGGTFSQLQSIIDGSSSGDVINITGDYSYDSGFQNYGVSINKPLTIIGNGHTLDGLGKARCVITSASNVIFYSSIIMRLSYKTCNSTISVCLCITKAVNNR